MPSYLNKIKPMLDERVELYNNPSFIENDPIQIPKQLQNPLDIELMAFLVATFSWGKRQSIINNGNKLLQIMQGEPANFIAQYQEKDFPLIEGFVHRTFQPIDLHFFLLRLRNVIEEKGSLESFFITDNPYLHQSIIEFNDWFFEVEHLSRTRKHLANPAKGSAAKRIYMFLRWMVRNDDKGVDFGIWKNVSPSQLSLPLDVHTGNVARHLKLTTRKQSDLKTLQEIDEKLRILSPEDPVKYDYALFGMGVVEGIK